MPEPREADPSQVGLAIAGVISEVSRYYPSIPRQVLADEVAAAIEAMAWGDG